MIRASQILNFYKKKLDGEDGRKSKYGKTFFYKDNFVYNYRYNSKLRNVNM